MVVTWSDLSIIFDFFADACCCEENDKEARIKLPPYLKYFLVDDYDDNNPDSMIVRTLSQDAHGLSASTLQTLSDLP
jgi:hypothetical protein